MTALQPPVENWFNSLNRNLPFCNRQRRFASVVNPGPVLATPDTANHPVANGGETTAAWLAAATANLAIGSPVDVPSIKHDLTTRRSSSLEDITNLKKDRLTRKTSILKNTHPTAAEVNGFEGCCEKKNVRFADSLGYQLEAVKFIISSPDVIRRHSHNDSPTRLCNANGYKTRTSLDVSAMRRENLPVVPASAYRDLTHAGDHMPDMTPAWMQPETLVQRTVMLEFVQPFSAINFLDRVKQQRVCLENCLTSSGTGDVNLTCIIRVLNISFEKSVSVRYTTNAWLSTSETGGTYIPGSNDGWSDKFTCTFSAKLMPGQRITFAVRYTANGEQYWDNNNGHNYSLLYML